MLKIGPVQIPNSTEIEENFLQIEKCLQFYASTKVDVILFPECGLSGFSAQIKNCTLERLLPYLERIQHWSNEQDTVVILPTAIHNDGLNFNTGFIFQQNQREQFFKIGLTDGEKIFFSLPENQSKKIFTIKNFNLGLLICYEIEQSPWTYFSPGDVDVILWPGYWGRNKEDSWDNSGPIYRNMEEWRCPLIQSNFSRNNLANHNGAGPQGLNLYINADNKLFAEGPFEQNSCSVIELKKESRIEIVSIKTIIL